MNERGNPFHPYSSEESHSTEMQLGQTSMGELNRIEQQNQNYERIRELESIKQKLEDTLRESMADHLTGCPDRTWADIFLKKMFDPIESNDNLSFWMIDFNNLKDINDQRGHVAGDLYIKHLVDLLKDKFNTIDNDTLFELTIPIIEDDKSNEQSEKAKKVINNSNVLMRIGGDEFVLLCRDNDLSGIGDDFEDLLRDNPDVSLAFGGVLYDRNKYSNISDIKNDADQLMYAKKSEQKNSQGQ